MVFDAQLSAAPINRQRSEVRCYRLIYIDVVGLWACGLESSLEFKHSSHSLPINATPIADGNGKKTDCELLSPRCVNDIAQSAVYVEYFGVACAAY